MRIGLGEISLTFTILLVLTRNNGIKLPLFIHENHVLKILICLNYLSAAQILLHNSLCYKILPSPLTLINLVPQV